MPCCTEPSVSPGNFLAEVSLTPSAFLTWSALQVDQQNGELQGYRLNCFPEDGGPTIAVQVTGTSVTLGVVQDNAHYTCTICAFTSVGCGPLSITYFSTYGDCKSMKSQQRHSEITCISFPQLLLAHLQLQ